MSETKCPKCGSTLVIEIANGKHCNSCGLDFGIERNPISAAAAERGKQGVVGWKREEVTKT